MVKFGRLMCIVATGLLSPEALAHEGHGHPAHQDGVIHYLVNPSHALPVVLTCAAATFAVWAIRRIVQSRSSSDRLR